jgi:hypothetical protein
MLEHAIDREHAEIERRVREARSPDTAPERVATLLVEDFEDLPSPVGFAQTLVENGSRDRARAVASEALRIAPRSVTALTLAAEVARTVDGEREPAHGMLTEALEAPLDPDGTAELARHLLEAGRLSDALSVLEPRLADRPEDDETHELRALALERIHRRYAAAEQLAPHEQAVLERFSDRGLIYRLRYSLAEFIEQRPELHERLASNVQDWLEELEELRPAGPVEDDDELEQRSKPIVRMANEQAWLLGASEEGDDDDEESVFLCDAEMMESDAPLALFAADPDTPPELADAARLWLATCTYGLWQVSVPVPSPGMWLTDIVSGMRRYAAIPPEQLQHACRWSVLMGALVALDGAWRTTGALVPLRPGEADEAAELVIEATADLVEDVTGKRLRGRPGRDRAPLPHGVLSEWREPASPPAAELMDQVLANLIPTIAAGVWRRRAARPALTNTEGHRLLFIAATINVGEGASARKRLAAHPDFRTDRDAALTWWGPQLTDVEHDHMLAEMRARLFEEPGERPRWLRARLAPCAGGFRVEVNSEERLALLIDLLDELGLAPEPKRCSVIDPAHDMAPIEAGGPMPSDPPGSKSRPG